MRMLNRFLLTIAKYRLSKKGYTRQASNSAHDCHTQAHLAKAGWGAECRAVSTWESLKQNGFNGSRNRAGGQTQKVTVSERS